MLAPRPTLTLLPDFDDHDPTALSTPYTDDEEPTRVRGGARESYVRLRPGVPVLHEEVERFTTMMNEDQVSLGMKLLGVAHAVDGVPYDVSARAAAGALRQRYCDVADVADALNELYFAALRANLPAVFAPDAPLGPFLKGIYIWCDGVVEALAILGDELRRLTPDWMTLRRRMKEASQFYFNGLIAQIRAHLAALEEQGSTPELTQLSEALEELFFATTFLEKRLEKRFG